MPHSTLKQKDWFHPDGFPISVERRDPQEPSGLHAHEFSEIVIITAGHDVHVTELNVTEIAFRVGFSDSNYFARQFRKLLGVTLSQYRRLYAVIG